MTVFVKFFILDIVLFVLGTWFLYDAIKHPYRNNKQTYNSNFINHLRAIGILVFAVIVLIALIFKIPYTE